MLKTVLKWVVLTLLLAYVACMAIWAGNRAQDAVCRGIDIRIANGRTLDSLTNAGVRAIVSRYAKPMEGKKTALSDTRRLERRLSSLSNFETVECAYLTDGLLQIDVTPMVPEIRVFDGGKSYYLNKNGKRMESNAAIFADVPVVGGVFSESFPASSLLGTVRFIQKDPVLSQLVGMVEAKDADNILLIPRIHGHVINFGDTSRLKEKSAAVTAFYRRVMPHMGWDAYDTISVRFRGQVVASRRDKARAEHTALYEEDYDPEEATLPETGESRETPAAQSNNLQND